MSPQAEKRLDFAWRVLAVAGTLFMAGVAFSGYVKLPAQVAAVKMTVDSFRVDHTAIHKAISGMERTVRESLCLQIAEKEHRDWRTCIQMDSLP